MVLLQPFLDSDSDMGLERFVYHLLIICILQAVHFWNLCILPLRGIRWTAKTWDLFSIFHAWDWIFLFVGKVPVVEFLSSCQEDIYDSSTMVSDKAFLSIYAPDFCVESFTMTTFTIWWSFLFRFRAVLHVASLKVKFKSVATHISCNTFSFVDIR